MSTPFPPLKNDRVLRAIHGQQIDRIPVWVMRQAGRYLPEFREVRTKADFFTMCRTPALACEVTLQPIERYDLDAAIIFSDILVVPQALGMVVEMHPGKGPVLPQPLKTPADLARLADSVDVHKELGYVMDAITLTRHTLAGRVPLFGFCGSPWTLLAYMVEGGGSKVLSEAKTWIFRYPEASHALLKKVTDVSIDYLVAQVQAGAQLLQVFDSWGGELSPADFAIFSLPYLKRIATEVKARLGANAVPMVIFAKNAHYALPDLAASDFDVIQLDWTMDPVQARHAVGPHKALQGNLDPGMLYADKPAIDAAVAKMGAAFGASRYIANLGHGMHPDHDPEHLKWFIDAVHAIPTTN